MRSRLVFPNKKSPIPLLKVRTTKSLKKEEKDSQCGPLCPHLSESNQDLFQRVCKKSTQALYSSTFTYRNLHISKEVLKVALWTLLKSYWAIIMVLTYKYVTRSFQLRTLCNLGRVICNKLLCVLPRKCYSERRFRYSASFCKTYRVSKMKNSWKKGYVFFNFY